MAGDGRDDAEVGVADDHQGYGVGGKEERHHVRSAKGVRAQVVKGAADEGGEGGMSDNVDRERKKERG